MARYQSYVYGNTARREEKYEVPSRFYAREERVRNARKQRNALSLDLPYLFVLIIATIACLFICYNYLRVQSSIATTLKGIEIQEAALEELRSDNDALETRINTSMNLDYVYKVATNELGMVYVNKNQIITYDRVDDGYVRQYDDIPQ